MKKILPLLMVLCTAQMLAGCAIVHRYPTYRGTVLELGTDKPIEAAGVLAVYRERTYWPPEGNTRYVGYQAALTDGSGNFEIPSKFFFDFFPLALFDSWVRITIYKRGYGNFPGSFPFYDPMPGMSHRASTAKEGRVDPILELNRVPSRKKVTFWLPKLETAAEHAEHDQVFSGITTDVLEERSFPPPGTSKIQFLAPKY